MDRGVISPGVERALAKSRYERVEVRAAQRLLQPGDTVLELGSGLGFMSASLRRKTQVGRIVTYEANPNLIDYIRDLHRLNGIGDVEVRHGVVLANPSKPTIPFHLRTDMWGSSLSLVGNPTDGAIRCTVEVPVVAWTDVLAEIQPTALVIDIEGGEFDLIVSCDLGSIRRMVVELHPAVYGVAGMAGIFGALERKGFRYAPPTAGGSVLALER